MARHPALGVWLGQALLAVTGSLERPGGVWFNPLFAYQDDLRPTARRGTGPAPGPASRPELPSWAGQMPSVALVDEIEAGNLRALLVLGANPTPSLPQPARLRAALASLDVLAVCDVTPTDATDLATHVLAGTSQLERPDVNTPAGPVVHGQHTAAIFPPPAGRRSTWWWLDQLGRRLGHNILGRHEALTDDDDLLAAVTHARLPIADLKAHPSGFVSEEVAMGWVERNQLVDQRWDVAPEPLVSQLAETQLARRKDTGELRLVVRRQVRHANSVLTRTASGPAGDEPGIYLHPQDAECYGLEDGDAVEVISAHGALHTRARHDTTLPVGVAAIPHGWQDDNVACLVSGAVDIDPITGMPELTGIAITARRI